MDEIPGDAYGEIVAEHRRGFPGLRFVLLFALLFVYLLIPLPPAVRLGFNALFLLVLIYLALAYIIDALDRLMLVSLLLFPARNAPGGAESFRVRFMGESGKLTVTDAELVFERRRPYTRRRRPDVKIRLVDISELALTRQGGLSGRFVSSSTVRTLYGRDFQVVASRANMSRIHGSLALRGVKTSGEDRPAG